MGESPHPGLDSRPFQDTQWRDLVGVRPRLGLLTECTGNFRAFSPSCYAVLMSSMKSETAVYGCNPALLKFYECRVDVLQNQIFLRSISLAAMFIYFQAMIR